MPSASPSDLLGADFVRELEVMRRRLEIRARSGNSGDHVARRRGGSAEFHDHRAYSPGDDLRRIDWAAYARTGEPVLKLFRAEEDVIARLVCDTSASMDERGAGADGSDQGTRGKLDTMRRMAAAIGYMTLAGGERAQLLVAGEGLVREHAPARGRGGLGPLLRNLAALSSGGATDLGKAIDATLLRASRPGMLVVLSDYFDPGPVTAALGRAVQAGHDVAIVHVVAPDEVEPTLEGDWELEDAETGAHLEVTMDASALAAYVLRFAGLCEELQSFARRHSAVYVRVRTDEALEGAVRRLVSRSIE